MATGFSPLPLNYLARNANDVAVMLGDTPIAFAQTTDSSTQFGTEVLYGIGSAMPQEIQQLKILPNVTLSYFTLTSDGLTLASGNQDLLAILSNNQFNVHLFSGRTNSILKTYVQTVAVSASENVRANAIITANITFYAMDVWDENGKSILNPGSAFAIQTLVSSLSSQTGLGLSP